MVNGGARMYNGNIASPLRRTVLCGLKSRSSGRLQSAIERTTPHTLLHTILASRAFSVEATTSCFDANPSVSSSTLIVLNHGSMSR